MKVFGMKRTEPTDADRLAAARLSAVAARFKRDRSNDLSDLTESASDPLGAPEATEHAVAQPEPADHRQAPGIDDASGEPEAPKAAEEHQE
jgi:hypothetical protein